MQIERVLEKVRPFLNRDGGDVTYLGFKDGTVYLKMTGACEGCLYAEAFESAFRRITSWEK